MLGRWKNIDELEECLSLPELDLVLSYKRKQDQQDKKFMAAIQGIDLDKHMEDDVQSRIDAIKHRVAVQLAGSEEALEQEELSALGFGYQAL